MKLDWTHLDNYRITHPVCGNAPKGATYGMFSIPIPKKKQTVAIIIANDGTEGGWEHVSCHVRIAQGTRPPIMRVPSYDELCWLKDLFWESHECAMQFHVPKTDHINRHQHCLHLWRRAGANCELPPTIMV